jgi:hypothetical protein
MHLHVCATGKNLCPHFRFPVVRGHVRQELPQSGSHVIACVPAGCNSNMILVK